MVDPKVLLIIFIVLFSVATGFSETRVALLPINSLGIDEMTSQVTESLIRMELSKNPDYYLISHERVREESGYDHCMDVDCAVTIGSALEADEVISINMSKLGSKIIIHFMAVDVKKGKVILVDQTTSESVEDLDAVSRRIADSIIGKKQISESGEIGNITAQENKGYQTRKAMRVTGFSFGYIYPTNAYNESDRIFTADMRFGYETEKYGIGSLIGIRYGFAFSIYGQYLLTKTDFSPFLGCSAGFHLAAHTDNQKDHEDGFMFTASTGFLAFRTYNFVVLFNLEYAITLNDYDDQALIFTIGLLKRI